MFYTLAKWFIWLLAASVIGVIIGWLLRGISARSAYESLRSTIVDGPEVERMRNRLAVLEPIVVERNQIRDELAALKAKPAAVAPEPAVDAAPAAVAVVALDLDAGKATLGKTVKVDDLKMIEGVGPKLEELLNGIGIHNWADLAAADVDSLKAMIAAGGPSVQMHDPSTWPQQATLLAAGQWDEFKALTDSLSGGRD